MAHMENQIRLWKVLFQMWRLAHLTLSSGDRSTQPNLGSVQVSFVEYEKRNGVSTAPYLDSIRKAIKGIPGAQISVAQEQNGPPTDPPINIEVASEDFDQLTSTATSFKNISG